MGDHERRREGDGPPPDEREQRLADALAGALDRADGEGLGGEGLPDEAARREVNDALGAARFVRDGLRPGALLDDVTRRRLRRDIVRAVQTGSGSDRGIGTGSGTGSGTGTGSGIGTGGRPSRVVAWIGGGLAAAAALFLAVTTSWFMTGKAPARDPVATPASVLRASIAGMTPEWPVAPVPRGLWDKEERPEERLGALVAYGAAALREAEFQALRRRYLATARAPRVPLGGGATAALVALPMEAP